MYAKMLLVNVGVNNGFIEILPNYGQKTGWTAHDVPKEDIGTLPLNVTPIELGVEIARAFDRCK